VFAIVTEHEAPPAGADPEVLWAHEAAVEAAMEQGAVLPMRVGSSFVGEAELLEALGARLPEFRRMLQRVKGAVELGIRAVVDVERSEGADPGRGPEPAGAGPGTAYMLSRLERMRSGERLAAAIHAPLAALSREATWRLDNSEPRRLIAAYLVDRARVEMFSAQVAELEHGRGIAIVCTGPWPPYSFVSEDDQ
jgi:gas vesicle protein GvpL/GvpF